MSVFEFVIAIIALSTLGKLASEWIKRSQAAPSLGGGKGESLEAAIDDLSRRLTLLEEERDFYRDLLEAPEPRREIRSPRPTEEGTDESGSS